MPSLTIKPPRPPSERDSSSPPQRDAFTFSAPPPASITFAPPPEPSSPVAPEYSPITPKVQPALPASLPPHHVAQPPPSADTSVPDPAAAQPIAPSAEYILPPPPKPFSSEDSADAIALRAAISALQFQKKKAQEDLRALEATKTQALHDPQHFRDELAAGRLHEQRPEFGGLQAILDQTDSDDDDDAPAGAGTRADGDVVASDSAELRKPQKSEVSESQPSLPATLSATTPPPPQAPPKRPDFAGIPGPQNIVRMPYINWDKYHIVGESLEQMHEQQRRWPGHFAYGQDRGREFTVAAPFSPFQDTLDGQQG